MENPQSPPAATAADPHSEAFVKQFGAFLSRNPQRADHPLAERGGSRLSASTWC
jgi:hypothetical protein